MNQVNMQEIIEGCVRNDRRAQEKLFRAFYGKMMNVVYRYVPDNDTAQEVLQNAFIKIFEKLATYNNQGSFEGWIRRIVVNTAIDSIRKNKHQFNELSEKNGAEYFEDPIEQKELEEVIEIKNEMALKAIEALSPGYRTVFNLYVFEDFTHKQIAEKLGISEGSSKSNFAKARAKLIKILNDQIVNIH